MQTGLRLTGLGLMSARLWMASELGPELGIQVQLGGRVQYRAVLNTG